MQTQLTPRHGTDLIDFAREVVDLLLANQAGLDQSGFIEAQFGSGAALSPEDRNFYWSEFKRAARYSTAMFELGEEDWVFIRALGGPRRGQYYYLAVAVIEAGKAKVVVSWPLAEQLHERTSREWDTRTKNKMRVEVADVQAKLASGDPQLVAQAEEQMDNIVMISTRLAAINFDSGMSIEDLKQLANPRDRRLRILIKPIKKALKAIKRAQSDVNELADLVYGLKELMTDEPQRLGQGAGLLDREA